METLKKIQKLINDTNKEIFDLYKFYPTVGELADSEQYKILTEKVQAYEKVFRIVQDDLRELRNMVGKMTDF